jgi:hypothetical protein
VEIKMDKLRFSTLSVFLTGIFLILLGVYFDLIFSSENFMNEADPDVKFTIRLDDFGEKVFKDYPTNFPSKKVKVSPRKIASKKPSLPVHKPKEQVTALENESIPVAQEQPVSKEKNLVLVEAINPMRWRKPLTGAQVSGHLKVLNKAIESFSVTITPDVGPSVSLSFEFTAIRDGGSFTVEQDGKIFFGLFAKDGNKKFIIRFPTGPLQGSLLYFEDEMGIDEKREAEYNKIADDDGLEEQLRMEEEEMNSGSFGAESDLNQEPFEEEAMPTSSIEEGIALVDQYALDRKKMSEQAMNEYSEESGFEY